MPTGPAEGPGSLLARANRLPALMWLGVIAALLAGSWGLTFAAGGTRTALPHVFYLPIVLAALPFGRRGGLVAGLVATVLCGPLMPWDATAGVAQDLANWSTRGAFFVAVGLLAGATVDLLRSTLTHHVTREVQHEIALARAATRPPEVEAGRRIRQVLDDRSFHTVFQPIYSLTDGHLVAVEALTRFDAEPHRPPDVWFDEAAHVGMSLALDLAVIDMALTAASNLPRDVALHLNVEPPTLADPRLLQLLSTVSGRHQIVVEVTEHVVVDDYRRLELAREQLREQGVQLAVDDTGAGFSSLRHVVRLAPDMIKIDRSLVHDMLKNPVREAMAGALVQFAKDTGTVLVAEGIEAQGDLVAWQKAGAHTAQGYLLARPGPLPAPSSCAAIPQGVGRLRVSGA
jgi:EAL domain-containing protein (putative c-di-GMP-specific phosphodiesterase class I)